MAGSKHTEWISDEKNNANVDDYSIILYTFLESLFHEIDGPDLNVDTWVSWHCFKLINGLVDIRAESFFFFNNVGEFDGSGLLVVIRGGGGIQLDKFRGSSAENLSDCHKRVYNGIPRGIYFGQQLRVARVGRECHTTRAILEVLDGVAWEQTAALRGGAAVVISEVGGLIIHDELVEVEHSLKVVPSQQILVIIGLVDEDSDVIGLKPELADDAIMLDCSAANRRPGDLNIGEGLSS